MRQSHRKDLSMKPGRLMRRSTSTLLLSSSCAIDVKDIVEKLNHLCDIIDDTFIPSGISRFYNYNKLLHTELKIIDIFHGDGLTDEEFNFIVLRSRLSLILYKVKDSSLSKNRTSLIETLCFTKVNSLNVAAKAYVLHALMMLKVHSDRNLIEGAILNLILNTVGNDLTELKCLTDCKGCFLSLHRLIFTEIRTRKIRTKIIEHIVKEAKMVDNMNIRNGLRNTFNHYENIQESSTNSFFSSLIQNISRLTDKYVRGGKIHLETHRSKMKPSDIKHSFTKVLSDIDDTMVCSGGLFPAGIDKRFKRKTVYPGVLSFYREIDLGIYTFNEWTDEYLLGNLVFLSARPHVYKDFTENQTFSKFHKLVSSGTSTKLHTMPNLLPGNLSKGRDYLLYENILSLAENKAENFSEYASVYPEFDYVFIGDNGQGDYKTAQMISSINFCEVKASFIHLVQSKEETFGIKEKDVSDDEIEYNNDNIYFFTNYLDAGRRALEMNLILPEGLSRIAHETSLDFDEICAKNAFSSNESRLAYFNDLNSSIDKINTQFPLLKIPKIGIIQEYQNGSIVYLGRDWSYSSGMVTGFNREYGIYKISKLTLFKDQSGELNVHLSRIYSTSQAPSWWSRRKGDKKD